MTASSPEPGTSTAGASGTAGASRRPTRQRAALAELMSTTSEFLSAQDLHSKLQSRGDSVGLATVYRNLQAMAADGDVDVLRTDDGECVYRSCATDAHHHHLVCRECGRTVEVEGPAVERWATRGRAPATASPTSPTPSSCSAPAPPTDVQPLVPDVTTFARLAPPAHDLISRARRGARHTNLCAACANRAHLSGASGVSPLWWQAYS